MSFFDDLGLGPSLAQRIRLESADDRDALTLKDGSLMSVLCIDGAMRLEDPSELTQFAQSLRVSLAPLLSRPGHAIELFFSRDPAAAYRHVEQIVARQNRRAHDLGLDLSDIIADGGDRWSNVLVGETCLCIVYTRPLDEFHADRRYPSTPEERCLNAPSLTNDMVARHQTLTDALCRDLHNRGRKARKLDVVEALQEIRAALYPFSAPWKTEWTPKLPFHLSLRQAKKNRLAMMPARDVEMELGDFSNLAAPSFDQQLATEDVQVLDSRSVRMGDTIFSAFDVTVAPEILTPFNDLVAETLASPMPMSWRCRFLIEPGGLQALRLKEQLARLFAFSAPLRNARIRDAIAALRELDGAGDTVVRLRLSFATWSRVHEGAELRRKRAILQRAAEQWGNLSTDGISADPVAALLATSAGLGPEATAPSVAAPLSDALAMLPMARQASPWKEGPVIFRSQDGKIWPYWPGSSRQNNWVEIYSGTPGSGKSVAMHAINRSCLLAPHAVDSSRAELPRIAILDIGRSSKGFIDLIRDSLPADRRLEAAHLKLSMTVEHAINPFDTFLGLRRPLAEGRSFMVNFLSLLCGSETTRCPITGVATASLDQAFEDVRDSNNPKPYIEGDEPEVDLAIAKAGLSSNDIGTWWEATDALFSMGFKGAAQKAQTRAVPVLADLITASHADPIASLYSQARVPGSDEPVMNAFHRLIAEAMRDYCILSAPTRFDVGPARIAALDLEEVTGGFQGGANATRQAALMYMLARQSMVSHWLVSRSEINKALADGTCPPAYQAFHLEAAKTNPFIPKLLCIDEFHRTGGLAGLRRQILQDAREGRKNNIRIALASQLPSDFGSEILDVVSTMLIFDAPSESTATFLAKRFGLSDAEMKVLRHQLNGPTEEGAPFFAVIRHSKGVARQLLYLTLGAAELWALSTTAEDSLLRESLTDRLGARAARVKLAAKYPTGSAKADIEIRAARQAERQNHGSLTGIIEQLVSEMVKE